MADDTSMTDYTDGQTFHVGDRVELSPGMDLWARGARVGTITRMFGVGRSIIAICMDNKRVRNLVYVTRSWIRPAR